MNYLRMNLHDKRFRPAFAESACPPYKYFGRQGFAQAGLKLPQPVACSLTVLHFLTCEDSSFCIGCIGTIAPQSLGGEGFVLSGSTEPVKSLWVERLAEVLAEQMR
jgi:hypothetical protein